VRTLSHDSNAGFAQTMIEALKNSTPGELPTVVGIDLLAEENSNSALEKAQSIYIPIYDAWKNKGTIELGGMTMHAGEHGEDYGSHNVRDAIIMGCTRIGHGTLLYDEPIFLEYNRRKQVPMVQNLAANWRLNVIEEDKIEKHPFIEMLRLGVPLTLSTDDEGMFHTDIANECEIAILNSDIQYSELKQLSYNSVTASFANSTVKESLLSELDAKFESFEASYKNHGVNSSDPAGSSAEAEIEGAQEEENEAEEKDSAVFMFPSSLFVSAAAAIGAVISV